MFKMDKKGLELSINMIVIVVISVVTLIIILGFITGFFDNLRLPEPPDPLIEPTRNVPITVSKSTLDRGRDNEVKIGFFNNEDSTVTSEETPSIRCSGIEDIEINSIGLDIPVGSSNIYATIIKLPSDTPASGYPCVIGISETERSFTFTVR